jgi:outer membrane protein assembly factor BamB
MWIPRQIAFSVLVAAAASAGTGLAQDWSQWRGSQRNGVLAAVSLPSSWPDQLTQRWKVEVGPGYATPLLDGDRIYMFSRKGENEVMRAVNAATGETLWETEYPAAFTMQRSAARHGPGPKSTPVLSNGRIYSIGMTGAVTCFDAASGKILWQHEGDADHLPMYTTHSFSPLVDGGLVYFHTGGHNQGSLKAYEANTGAIRWSWEGDGPGYGSPILAELSGTRQLITITQMNLIGLDPATGRQLWLHPYATRNFTNSMTPLLYGETLIVSANELPVSAVRVVKRGQEWQPEVIWVNDEVTMRMTNGVILQDMLFSLSTKNSGQYFSLDPKTGKTLWLSAPRQAENASILRSDSLVFSLEDDGELVIFRPGRDAFEPVKRYQLSGEPTWTQPVISGNRVFVKDVTTLALWIWD